MAETMLEFEVHVEKTAKQPKTIQIFDNVLIYMGKEKGEFGFETEGTNVVINAGGIKIVVSEEAFKDELRKRAMRDSFHK